jgi:hypothetical protein
MSIKPSNTPPSQFAAKGARSGAQPWGADGSLLNADPLRGRGAALPTSGRCRAIAKEACGNPRTPRYSRTVPDAVGKLAYDETVRAIAGQANVLDGLRSRAGVLLAAASLVTAFLGGQALALPIVKNGVVERSPIGGWGVVAVVAFVGVAFLTITILWPYQWRFAMGAGPILAAGADPDPISFDDAQAQLAKYHEENYDLNEPKIDRLFWVFRVACLLLTVETVAWILDLQH